MKKELIGSSETSETWAVQTAAHFMVPAMGKSRPTYEAPEVKEPIVASRVPSKAVTLNNFMFTEGATFEQRFTLIFR
jgi:hypothetical protein